MIGQSVTGVTEVEERRVTDAGEQEGTMMIRVNHSLLLLKHTKWQHIENVKIAETRSLEITYINVQNAT